jgi:hypothetical protein
MAETTKRGWMPTVAGILLFIDGVFALLRGLGRMFVGGLFETMPIGLGLEIAGGLQVVLAVIIVIGGIFALQRKVWWLALIASIFAIFTLPLSGLLGILAVIFIALSKKEFA